MKIYDEIFRCLAEDIPAEFEEARHPLSCCIADTIEDLRRHLARQKRRGEISPTTLVSYTIGEIYGMFSLLIKLGIFKQDSHTSQLMEDIARSIATELDG